MAEYRDRHAEIRALGADLAALSVDDAARSEPLRLQLGLRFPILCDSRREVVRSWDLYNEREKGGIAIPAVFVVDRDRRVRYRSIDATARRVSAEHVLRFLREGTLAGPAHRAWVRAGFVDFARAVANMIRRGVRAPHR